MEKFQENIDKAIKSLQIADHMTYVTFPLVNEKRLLIKIFSEIYKSIINSINAMLNYESLYKRIKIYTDKKENIQTFTKKVAKIYDLTNEQVKKIKEIIEINKRHQQSSMEFIKKDRVIILSDNLSHQILDIQKIKEYLLLAKELLMKINSRIK